MDAPAANYTVALGINDNGQVVGYYDKNGVQHGFLAT
jgi:probable HAF family extracellular repeat protein